MIPRFLGLALISSALMAGCSTEPKHPVVVVSPTGEVYVPDTPPQPKRQLAGAPPNPGDVWAPGFWSYHDAQWVWMPGEWRYAPQSGRTWVSGHWDRSDRGWVWTSGHWE